MKDYVGGSAVAALVLTALDGIADWWTGSPVADYPGIAEALGMPVPAVWILAFLLSFAIFLAISWWWGEYQTRRYVRTMSELEN